jgi:YggT family protein|tara:strand:- start:149 stop:724 length:576 start_codon:yes stop_codon:yes gene_type:complete
LTEATIYLFKSILDVISVVILITFFFRLLKVDYYNPLVQGMLKFADIFTSLIRSIFKPIFGIDLASLITAAALQAFCFFLISLSDEVLFSFGIMISWSLFSVLLLGLTIGWWALVGGIIMSWVAPVSSFPPSRLLLQMSNQICKPFRLFLPPIGGLDFSPILAFLILQFLWGAVYGLSTGAGLPMYLSMGS